MDCAAPEASQQLFRNLPESLRLELLWPPLQPENTAWNPVCGPCIKLCLKHSPKACSSWLFHHAKGVGRNLASEARTLWATHRPNAPGRWVPVFLGCRFSENSGRSHFLRSESLWPLQHQFRFPVTRRMENARPGSASAWPAELGLSSSVARDSRWNYFGRIKNLTRVSED